MGTCSTPLVAELATARVLTIGATGTKALAPAKRLKNARDVFMLSPVFHSLLGFGCARSWSRGLEGWDPSSMKGMYSQ